MQTPMEISLSIQKMPLKSIVYQWNMEHFWWAIHIRQTSIYVWATYFEYNLTGIFESPHQVSYPYTDR